MLDLLTLKYRRFRGDMIQVYKIINNVNNIYFDTFFFVDQNQRKLEVRKYIFSSLIVTLTKDKVHSVTDQHKTGIC